MSRSIYGNLDLVNNQLLNALVHKSSTPPSNVEAKLYYDVEDKLIYYYDGGRWVPLGEAGAGGPPSGAAGGDLSGTYPSPQIAAGVIVDADVNAAAAIATSKIAGLDTALSGKALNTVDLTAGGGLTGGGTIAANRTFAVGAGTGITVNADDVAINRTVVDTWYQAAGSTGGSAGGDLSGTYPNPQIAAGVIVDADINAAANIAQSKISGLTTSLSGKADNTVDLTAGAGLTGGGTIAASRTFNIGAGTGITVNADDVALNLTYTDARYLLLSGGTLTNFLTLHADPTNPMHAATKQYVDLSAQGLDFKASAKAATTANITLSGTQTVDGVALVVGDRVLVKDQSTGAQNGIYIVAAGAWTRATDADANGEISDGMIVPVEGGTVNGDGLIICTSTTATPWVPNSSGSTYTKFLSVTDLVAGAGLTKTGSTIDFVAGNATLTVSADSVVVASAPKWTTGQTITLTGDVTGVSAAWDGSAGISFATAIAAGSIVDADVNASAAIATSKISGLDTALTGKVATSRQVIAGNGLTGGGALTADVTLNVVSADANMTVAADAITIVAAPKWATARTITLGGDLTGNVSIDGSANVTLNATLAAGAGGKRYAANLGGTGTDVITHNLNTKDVIVNIYNTAGSFEEVWAEVEHTSVNTVTIRSTPALGTGFRAVVLA